MGNNNLSSFANCCNRLDGSRDVVRSTLGSRSAAFAYSSSITPRAPYDAVFASSACTSSRNRASSFRNSVGIGLPSSRHCRIVRFFSYSSRSLPSSDFRYTNSRRRRAVRRSMATNRGVTTNVRASRSSRAAPSSRASRSRRRRRPDRARRALRAPPPRATACATARAAPYATRSKPHEGSRPVDRVIKRRQRRVMVFVSTNVRVGFTRCGSRKSSARAIRARRSSRSRARRARASQRARALSTHRSIMASLTQSAVFGKKFTTVKASTKRCVAFARASATIESRCARSIDRSRIPFAIG